MAINVTNLRFDQVGKPTCVSAIACSDGTSGVVNHLITSDRGMVAFQNQGTGSIWYGGSTVDADNNLGFILRPYSVITYRAVNDKFQVYFVCTKDAAATLAVIEYEK